MKVSLGLIISISLVGFSALFAKEIPFTPTNENIANPERGFYDQESGLNENPSYSELVNNRKNKKVTLIRKIFRLDDYRNGPLSQDYLNYLTKSFSTIRDSKAKVIPRFAYNYERQDDASKAIVLGHIKQLGKILTENHDVIAYMEAGFIGHWGEWHHSSNKLDNRESKISLNRNNVEPGKEILEELLLALPTERMVVLRYNADKRQIFSSESPLTSIDAHKNTKRSRTGNLNDCFLAPGEDGGTYGFGASGDMKLAVDREKTFLSHDNRFVPQGGESCQVSEYSGCASAKADLKRMRWDAINMNFEDDVLDSWRNGNCMDSITTHLGYRLQLNKATLQDSAKPGSSWGMSFSIVNVGWGKIYNPRAVEVVFRQVNGKAKYRFPVPADPRFWLSDSNITVQVNAGIPKDMPEGEYKVFLNFPDPQRKLRLVPEYSIRLANANIWEDSTGFNDMKATVIIKNTTKIQPSPNNGFFTPWEADWVGIRDRSGKQGFAKTGAAPFSLFPSAKGWIDLKGRAHQAVTTASEVKKQ